MTVDDPTATMDEFGLLSRLLNSFESLVMVGMPHDSVRQLPKEKRDDLLSKLFNIICVSSHDKNGGIRQ